VGRRKRRGRGGNTNGRGEEKERALSNFLPKKGFGGRNYWDPLLNFGGPYF